MSKRWLLISLVSLSFLSACVIVVERTPWESERRMLRATFEKTLAINQGDEISLENARGRVEILGCCKAVP